MKAERDYVVEVLRKAGVKGKIHESLKSLKNSNEVHLAAVLRIGETFSRSSSKKHYEDYEGRKKLRKKLFEREASLHVIIADTDEEKVETILENFLINLSKGFFINGNWVAVEIGTADWVLKEDSILQSKIAVEFDLLLTGGIYVDTNVKDVTVGEIAVKTREE